MKTKKEKSIINRMREKERKVNEDMRKDRKSLEERWWKCTMQKRRINKING